MALKEVKKLTLLEQAKVAPVNSGRKNAEINMEEAEVCAAWVAGEVSSNDVQRVLKLSSSQAVYSRVSVVFRYCARAGLLSIVWNKEP